MDFWHVHCINNCTDVYDLLSNDNCILSCGTLKLFFKIYLSFPLYSASFIHRQVAISNGRMAPVEKTRQILMSKINLRQETSPHFQSYIYSTVYQQDKASRYDQIIGTKQQIAPVLYSYSTIPPPPPSTPLCLGFNMPQNLILFERDRVKKQ